ncbi:MarR family winged helix-turn-helix transcriptional regulator [Pelosinus sp. UFO1]|uniref:MarR family winged helix-turn-helix transcriptional regulator n=1 Tax=Pelosinus sp. UFO1 TaxID=484770 RepID=UPI0004D1ECB6|nr:MarR family transcriptional regulator [Pelosinus sp. UFO1]AIF50767.1 transcriptional regulator, MarR family [Pelosinus sp. UFO1]
MHFKLDDSLGFWINVVAGKMKNELNRSISKYDITAEQWAVLSRLWEEQGITQKDLAERTGKDQPNTGRILDKLEKKGLVNRIPDTQDRRIVLVYLTDTGCELKEKLIPIATDVLIRAQRGIDDKDITYLKQILEKLSRNI